MRNLEDYIKQMADKGVAPEQAVKDLMENMQGASAEEYIGLGQEILQCGLKQIAEMETYLADCPRLRWMAMLINDQKTLAEINRLETQAREQIGKLKAMNLALTLSLHQFAEAAGFNG